MIHSIHSVIASKAKQSIAPQAETWIGSSLRSSQLTNWPPASLPAATLDQTDKPYFGYLNSGAAFSASLVVFIDASHLSFLASWRMLTEDGDTAT